MEKDQEMPDWLKKCLTCAHSYRRQNDAETIYCRCRHGQCHYKPCKPAHDKVPQNSEVHK